MNSVETTLDEADRLARAGNLTDAEILFAHAVERAADVDAFLRYGDFLARQGRLEQANAIYGRVLGLSTVSDGDRAAAHQRRAEIAWRKGLLTEVDDECQRALELLRRADTPPSVAAAVYRLSGNVEFMRGNVDAAERRLWTAHDLYVRGGEVGGVALAKTSLGLLYRRRNDLSKAEQMQRDAIEIYTQMGDLGPAGANFANLGLVLRAKGEAETAEAMFRRALEIARLAQDRETEALVYGYLGAMEAERNRLPEARALLEQALRLEQSLNHSEGIARTLCKLGDVGR